MNIKKIKLVFAGYTPNTAVSNRMMGLLKTLSQMKIETEVHFFVSDNQFSHAPQMDYVTYKYWGETIRVKNNKIKNLLYLFVYSYLFVLSLKKGDYVYTYGCEKIVSLISRKKGIFLFHERTECPEVSRLKLVNLSNYYQACKTLDGLFVISSTLKQFFIDKGVPESKITIINMTVDESRFIGLEKENKEPYIAYCGKATNNKDGVDELIKSFALTVKKHPNVKLYIIGTPPSPKEESGNYELVEKLGLKNSIIFTGIVDYRKVPQILKNAVMLVLDRPNNEQAYYGFPTKLGEYLLTENPVVVTKVGDIPLFLRDKENALLSEPNNPKEFSSQMNWVLENPCLAKEIGRRGAETARINFNSNTESVKMISRIAHVTL